MHQSWTRCFNLYQAPSRITFDELFLPHESKASLVSMFVINFSCLRVIHFTIFFTYEMSTRGTQQVVNSIKLIERTIIYKAPWSQSTLVFLKQLWGKSINSFFVTTGIFSFGLSSVCRTIITGELNHFEFWSHEGCICTPSDFLCPTWLFRFGLYFLILPLHTLIPNLDKHDHDM